MVKPRTLAVVILALAAALAGCNADTARNPHAAQIWGPLECQRQGHWRPDWWKNPIAPRRYRWFDSGGPDNRPYRRLTVFDQPNRTVGERCQLGFDDWGHHWGTKGSFQVYREGDHRITAFWLRFRHNFPLHTRAWQIVSDMGQAEPALSAGGPPVLALYADRHRLHLLHYRRQLWRSAPVQKGTWIQIFENVVYSRHPNQGAIKVGVDLNGDGDRSDPGEHSHRIRTSTLKQETQPGGPIPRRASIPSVLRIGPYHAPAIHCPEGCSLDVGPVGVVRASRKPPPPGDSCGWGTFSATNEPGACWRPFADSSPWNTPVGPHPSVAPNSDAIVKRLLGFGRIAGPVSGSSGTAHDWYHPVYWSKPSDPVYTLHFAYKGADGLYHQVTRGSSPELEGAQIHIPADAQAASGSDHHLTVIDQSTGWEYSMYFEHLINLPPNGGDITAIGGGRENVITGDGRGVDATAGYFPAGAGDIRPAEIAQGEINHALFIEVHCTDSGNVYPADTGSTFGQELGSTRKCHSAGLPDADAPHNGQHFYLDYTDAEIDALPVPDWKKTILRAMAHYGMYVGDTGGAPWGLKFESGSSWTSFGLPDPWVTLARRHGLPSRIASTGRRVYTWNIASGVDWSRLRVVAPTQ